MKDLILPLAIFESNTLWEVKRMFKHLTTKFFKEKVYSNIYNLKTKLGFGELFF